MSKFLFCCVIFLLPVFCVSGLDQKTREAMLNHLDAIKMTFEAKYAPAEWKREFMGWDLDEQIQQAKEQVLAAETLSIKEYQRIVRGFIYSTQDCHVNIHFISTERARLPFHVKGIYERYFITAINRDQLPFEDFPICPGDELLLFDGQPVEGFIQEIKIYDLPNGNPETIQSEAEYILTNRSGASGQYVPKGPVTITVKSQDSNKTTSYQLIWDYKPEMIENHAFFPGEKKLSEREYLNTQFLCPYAYDLGFSDAPIKASFEGKNPNDLGEREGFLPFLGNATWEVEEDNPFHAYTFNDPFGRSIGYVRISHYQDLDRNEAEEFEKIIEVMEMNTDALIIDQMNNPGGNVFLVYALLSMLTEKPLVTPKHRLMLTQEDVLRAIKISKITNEIYSNDDAKDWFGNMLNGCSVNFQFVLFVKEYANFIISEWSQGRILTQNTHIWGVDQINPHGRTRYTKPILMLVNGLCASGGDFAPAILQDNHRAVIMGSLTAGAGGVVEAQRYPNRFGIAGITLTTTLAERIGEQLIENLGVTPDISCTLTENDLRDDYADFVQSIYSTLDGMLPRNETSECIEEEVCSEL